MPVYSATLTLLIDATTVDTACDVISAMLNETFHTNLVDWAYIPDAEGKEASWPVLCPQHDAATYYETYVPGTFLPRGEEHHDA